MTASDKELEKQLTEAGEKLLEPPSSVEELLPLLDKVECFLSEVEQSPPDSMQLALSHVMKALVAERLFKHTDVDVNVAVAACISEITRITAPDAPYDDDQMREVFRLIVSSFENLGDMSSRSYSKRTSMLDTVAKVRSCVVMLDLECDALIIEMFQHFLKAIRDHHPDTVFSSMETIMTLVLEESEEISPELLSPILDYVRKDNEVPQISRKLAEQVLKSSTTKLKPYLIDAIKSLGTSLDDYSKVVASICEQTSGILKQNEAVVIEKDDDSQDNISGEVADEDKLKVAKVAEPEQADAPKDGSLRSEVSNGVSQIAENDSSTDIDSGKKQADSNAKDAPDRLDKLGNSKMGNADDEKETDVGNERDQQNHKKETQCGCVKPEESLKASDVEEETESKTPLDSKDGGKSALSSSCHDSSANTAISCDNEMETSAQASQSKPLAHETTNVASPSRSESLPDDSHSKKDANHEKTEGATKEAKLSDDSSAKVAPEEPSSSEAKPIKRSAKKVASSSKTKASVPTKKGTSGSKPAKQSGKKAVDNDNVQVPSKPKEDKRKQGRGKATDEEEQPHTLSDDDEKPSPKPSKDEEQPLEETPKTNAKRKRNLGKKRASEDKEFGEDLVGVRVKVWWPKDRAYYKGVVDSYDAGKRTHLVLYDDGDQEILNLRRETWDFIKDEAESTTVDEKGDRTGRDETSAMPQKKKAKKGNDHSDRQAKAETSAKKGAASNKSKAGKKPEEERNESKTEDTSKEADKAEDDGSDEMSEDEEKPKPSGKSAKAVKPKKEEDDGTDEMSVDEEKPKPGGKSAKAVKPKREEKATPKSGKAKEDAEAGTSKAKEEEPTKASSKSTKPKTSKKAVKSSGKPKPASASNPSSKAKESDGEPDSEDNPKASKGKSAGSRGKSSKKRKR